MKQSGQRMVSEPNPFITIDTFKPKMKRTFVRNKTGSSEVYSIDGEVIGGVIGFEGLPKMYDGKRFTKFYEDGLKVMLELSQPAKNVLLYFISVMNYSDTMEFNIRNCQNMTKYKDRSQIYKAIKELKDKEVIASTSVPKIFFINPLMIYRGDRLKLLDLE